MVSPFLFLCEMVSRAQPPEEAWEKLRKIKLIILTDPRDRRHAMPHGKTPVQAEGRNKGSTETMVYIGVSLGKARQGRTKTV